jgi:hypothetical protein
MPRFVQFLQHSGGQAEQSFMIVPRGGFNLVCLRDSKDVRLAYDRDWLQVDDVVTSTAHRSPVKRRTNARRIHCMAGSRS